VELIHDESGIYEAVPSPMAAGVFEIRALDESHVPRILIISAHTLAGEIMGVRSDDGLMEGIRFDPVSLLTPRGGDLLANFLEWAGVAPQRISA
jgi:anthranilate/para-aminobenzoate synthase component II